MVVERGGAVWGVVTVVRPVNNPLYSQCANENANVLWRLRCDCSTIVSADRGKEALSFSFFFPFFPLLLLPLSLYLSLAVFEVTGQIR